jgi:hypothetical protein
VDPAEPPRPVCVGVGHVVRIVTGMSPSRPWKGFSSSDPAVLRCDSARAPDGSARAECTGERAGRAVVVTGTLPFSGDPHGPAQRIWELTVTVTP